MADHRFPDGNDRTPNDPCLLLSAASLKRLYVDTHGSVKDGGEPYTARDLAEYVKSEMVENNWDEVEFINGQTLLKKNLQLRKMDMLAEPQQPVVRVTVSSNLNSMGKSTVLTVIEKALQAHGFRDVDYKPEDSERSRNEKYRLPVSTHPVLSNLRIELVEDYHARTMG